MRNRFLPWRILTAGMLAGGFLGAPLLRAGGLAAAAEQPVAYNHKAHVQKAGMACTKCHTGVADNIRAGFPPDIYCKACHASPRTASPEEARLIELLKSGQPLAWQQVTRLAPYTYFSHRRHVRIGNIDCAVCHGNMGERTIPIDRPAVDFTGRAGMFRCIECHMESGSRYARIDCADCHR